MKTALAALYLAGAVAAYSGPEVDSPEVRDLLGRGRFAPPQAQAALALLDRADRRGLPAFALVNRIREGVARHADPKVILGVLEDRVVHLERADDVVRGCAERNIVVRDRELSLMRIADALAQGVAPGDVLDLLPAAAKGNGDLPRVARAAEVLGHLARKGFAPKETREVVSAAVADAWSAERMGDLVGLFLLADAQQLSIDDTREAVLERVRERRADPGAEGETPRNAERKGGRPGADGVDGPRSAAEPHRDPRRERERE